jgi:hypothetical protein
LVFIWIFQLPQRSWHRLFSIPLTKLLFSYMHLHIMISFSPHFISPLSCVHAIELHFMYQTNILLKNNHTCSFMFVTRSCCFTIIFLVWLLLMVILRNYAMFFKNYRNGKISHLQIVLYCLNVSNIQKVGSGIRKTNHQGVNIFRLWWWFNILKMLERK